MRKQKEAVRHRQMKREVDERERERAGLLNISAEFSGSEASEQSRSTGSFCNEQIAALPKAYFVPHPE